MQNAVVERDPILTIRAGQRLQANSKSLLLGAQIAF
jgi:hypothetical protein